MAHQGDREEVEKRLAIVADSWDRLRGCDVHRLLDMCLGLTETLEHLDDYANVIRNKREDLNDRIEEAVEIITEEWLAVQ